MVKCTHFDQIKKVNPSAEGCEECLKSGSDWVHLRLCLSCGHVGCCDSSRNRHARKHFEETKHPIIKSFEPDEFWKWCMIDKIYIDYDGNEISAEDAKKPNALPG